MNIDELKKCFADFVLFCSREYDTIDYIEGARMFSRYIISEISAKERNERKENNQQTNMDIVIDALNKCDA